MIKKETPRLEGRGAAYTKATVRSTTNEPWHGYSNMVRAKTQAQRLSAIYYRAGVEVTPTYTRRGQRTAMCSNVVGVQNGKVVVQWRCEDRLCPICAVKSSRRVAANARMVIERAQCEAKLVPYMLTLTQKNCSREQLKERISDMIAAWDSISHSLRANRRYMQGYARTIEITVNYRDNTYHPHLHSILLLTPDAPREMLRAHYWGLLWQKYMDTRRYQGPVVPICDIRKIRPNVRRHITSTAAAAAEVSKYMTKSSMILSHSNAYEYILVIDEATRGRRLRAYGGVWRDIRRQLRLEDAVTATEPDAEYIANASIDIWQWAGATCTYEKIL